MLGERFRPVECNKAFKTLDVLGSWVSERVFNWCPPVHQDRMFTRRPPIHLDPATNYFSFTEDNTMISAHCHRNLNYGHQIDMPCEGPDRAVWYLFFKKRAQPSHFVTNRETIENASVEALPVMCFSREICHWKDLFANCDMCLESIDYSYTLSHSTYSREIKKLVAGSRWIGGSGISTRLRTISVSVCACLCLHV